MIHFHSFVHDFGYMKIIIFFKAQFVNIFFFLLLKDKITFVEVVVEAAAVLEDDHIRMAFLLAFFQIHRQ